MAAQHSFVASPAGRSNSVPLGYRWTLAGFLASAALTLLAVVDFRRGLLFEAYLLRSPYFAFHAGHIVLLVVWITGLIASYGALKQYEARMGSQSFDTYVKVLALVLAGLLVADLFTYRGVATARAAAAGRLGATWTEAFGVTGWLRPLALAVSYMLTVWHATMLGVLLAGLSVIVLPRYLKPLLTRTGLGGSLFGATFALPQPFCSCCAAIISPSLAATGASSQFALAFVVGSPMLNITGLVLAAILLPAPYALARFLAGLVLAIPVTYGVAWFADRWTGQATAAAPGRLALWMSQWVDLYCRLFHLDELVAGRHTESPARFLSAWLMTSARIGLLLIPTLFLLTLATAAIIQVLPPTFGNNVLGVVLASIVGTLMMISTWTEIPVSLQLLQAGLSGPAATLLVVLPPVSLPCLLILGGATGRFRVVAMLGLAVAATGIVAGLAFL